MTVKPAFFLQVACFIGGVPLEEDEVLVGWLPDQEYDEYVGVSKNSGTPKSSILIGFSIINHLFWGAHHFWKHPCRAASKRVGSFWKL